MSNLSLNSAILYLFHWLARTASRCRRDYILPLLFFSFLSFFLSFFFLSFFRRLISEVIERISTKLGHIFTCDCYLKNIGPNSTGHLPPQAGRKKMLFWDRLWNLTEHISATEHDINNRKETCQSTGTPLHAPMVQKRLRTVGEFLPIP